MLKIVIADTIMAFASQKNLRTCVADYIVRLEMYLVQARGQRLDGRRDRVVRCVEIAPPGRLERNPNDGPGELGFEHVRRIDREDLAPFESPGLNLSAIQ